MAKTEKEVEDMANQVRNGLRDAFPNHKTLRLNVSLLLMFALDREEQYKEQFGQSGLNELIEFIAIYGKKDR